MARGRERDVRFSGPGNSILNMVLFLGVVGAVAYYLSPLSPQPNQLLVESFMANPYLNGLILLVLVFGVGYTFSQANSVAPAISWINWFRYGSTKSEPGVPALISTLRNVLEYGDRDVRTISPATAQIILDSVGQRVEESRELSRYIGNLLVFLGLLGTFWGLLQTVTDVSGVISSLGQSSDNSDSATAVTALINNLNEPLSGMNTAFSSSLFGLGGSLVIGFLDIQAGQARNRFYSDLEDWLSTRTEVTTSAAVRSSLESGDLGEAMIQLHAAIHELNSGQAQSAQGVREEIRRLGRTLLEGDDPRDER